MTGELVVVIVSVGRDQGQNADSANHRFEVHVAVWAVVAGIALAVHRGQVDMTIPGAAAFAVGEKGSL